jgi:thiamine biosynthesis protein ThiI
MMKRGVKVKFLYIDTGKYAGKDCYTNVLRNFAALSHWTPGVTLQLSVVHAEAFFDQLMADAEPRFRCVLCKRAMLRISAISASRHGFPGVITGDNLGQVATQTLSNMVTISSGINIFIIRPLIGHDKEDIIALARRIGTFSQEPGDTSCGVLPPKPATSAGQDTIMEMERKLNSDAIFQEMVHSAQRFRALNGEVTSVGSSHPAKNPNAGPLGAPCDTDEKKVSYKKNEL